MATSLYQQDFNNSIKVFDHSRIVLDSNNLISKASIITSIITILMTTTNIIGESNSTDKTIDSTQIIIRRSIVRPTKKLIGPTFDPPISKSKQAISNVIVPVPPRL